MALGGVELVVLPLRAAAGRDHQGPLLHELLGDAHRLVEQAAGIGAQVEHQAGGAVGLEPIERGAHLGARGLGEVGQPQVAHPAVHDEGVAHALGDDLPPLDGDLDVVGLALAVDAERHVGPLGAAQQVGDLVDVEPGRALAVDLHDDVARAHAQRPGRAALDGRDDGRVVLTDAHLDAHAAEAAMGQSLEVLVGVAVEELRVGIQVAHHAVEGAVDELLRLDRIHVVLLDLVQDLDEQIEVLIEVPRARAAPAHPPAEAEEQQQQHAQDDAATRHL